MGLAHVRGKDNLSALFHEVLDGGESTNDSLIGGDNAILHRNVEIAANKHFLTGLDFDIFNRFLIVSHSFEFLSKNKNFAHTHISYHKLEKLSIGFVKFLTYFRVIFFRETAGGTF